MRRVLTAVVILLAFVLVLSRLDEVEQVLETLRRGNWLWLGLAAVCQLAWLANSALIYLTIYKMLAMPATLWQLLLLAATGHFVNIVAPSGGMGGMAVFVNDGVRKRLPPARVTIAGILYLILDYIAFLCVLVLGLAVLFRRDNLTGIEVGASALLLLAALTLAGMLALGAASPPTFKRVLLWATRNINRLVLPFLRREYLSEANAEVFATEAANDLCALRQHPRHYLTPAALMVLSKGLQILILALTFLAFGVPFSSGTIIAGYSIGYLFLIVSPTPGGIGVVEGALTLALGSLGVTLAAATILTLAFRGITFWLPLAYGFAAMRILQRQWGREKTEQLTP